MERNVAIAGNQVPFSADDISWVESEEFDAFLRSLDDLRRYYDENWDESILYVSVEVLNAYFLAIHALTGALLSPQHMRFHQAAREGIGALDAWMDAVIALGYAYLNENG